MPSQTDRLRKPRVNDRVECTNKRTGEKLYGTIVLVPDDSLYLSRYDKYYEVRLDKPIGMVKLLPLLEGEFEVIGHLCQ
jgi:hypothetical protein